MENLGNEIWKDIIGYEGEYKISNFGKVKSLKYGKEKLLSPIINSAGYECVVLHKTGKAKQILIHQLVAIVFLNHTPCKMKFVINHINFNIKDNHVRNLEIVTSRENSNRKHLKSTSKYTGVCLIKKSNRWRSQIVINRKTVNLGNFLTEIEASNAYQKKLKELNSRLKTTE